MADAGSTWPGHCSFLPAQLVVFTCSYTVRRALGLSTLLFGCTSCRLAVTDCPLLAACLFRYGIDGLIIDPYNELDPSRASGLKEHEHVNQTMAMLRKFARDYNVSTCRQAKLSMEFCRLLTQP